MTPVKTNDKISLQSNVSFNRSNSTLSVPSISPHLLAPATVLPPQSPPTPNIGPPDLTDFSATSEPPEDPPIKTLTQKEVFSNLTTKHLKSFSKEGSKPAEFSKQLNTTKEKFLKNLGKIDFEGLGFDIDFVGKINAFVNQENFHTNDELRRFVTDVYTSIDDAVRAFNVLNDLKPKNHKK